MRVRIRGPFSLAIFLLALFETLHWSLAADHINRSDFFEREVDNVRRIQASFLSSGDTIVRIATQLAERETQGRKHCSNGDHHQASSTSASINRKWSELGRRLREEKQLEISSGSLQVSDLLECAHCLCTSVATLSFICFSFDASHTTPSAFPSLWPLCKFVTSGRFVDDRVFSHAREGLE
jgi:hypothetical protein